MASGFSDYSVVEISVDVDATGQYPEGLFVLSVPMADVGNAGFAKAIHLRLPVAHPNDLKLYSAFLSSDGMRIRLIVPTVSKFFYEETVAMLEKEKKLAESRGIFCFETERKLLALAAKFAANKTLQTRTIEIQLSQKCRIFDKNWVKGESQTKARGWELKGYESYANSVYKGVNWPAVYMYWRVQVEDSYEETKTPRRDNDDDDDFLVNEMLTDMQLSSSIAVAPRKRHADGMKDNMETGG